MMIMWSEHSGQDDQAGRAVTGYMLATEWPKVVAPGVTVAEKRVPPPELLRGDPALMRRAIAAVTPFKHKYTSAVLSFHKDDVELARWNEGDSKLRREIDDAIEAFEETAFAGIEPADRPPTLWSTHTHAGRLELNFCCPRAIRADSKLRAFNPQPPGAENRKTWDALRDVLNLRYGWADPEAPARKRILSVPDYVLKQRATALRAGLAVEAERHDPREVIGNWVMARIKTNQITNRDQVINSLKAEGFEINRLSATYLTVKDPASGAKYRLKGSIFSESFDSVESLADGLIDHRGSQDEKLADAERRLAAHVGRRAVYNLNRYGKHLGYERKAAPPPPDLDEHLDWELGREAIIAFESRADALKTPSDTGPLLSTLPSSIGAGAIQPSEDLTEDRRQKFKARLWIIVFGGTLPPDLLLALVHIDTATKTVRLADGAVVRDRGDQITTTRATLTAAKLMVAEALAKGWRSVKVHGSEEFKQLVAVAAVEAGLTITNLEKEFIRHADRNGTPAADTNRNIGKSLGRARDEADRTDRDFDQALQRLVTTTRAADAGLRRTGLQPAPARALGELTGEQPALEIDQFKRQIDLREFAATIGYKHDIGASDRNHTVMRSAFGHKLVIGVAANGHWVYSANDGGAGTIVDLLQKKHGLSLGAIRKRLRPWIGAPEHRPKADPKIWTPQPKPAPTQADAMRPIIEWESASSAVESLFLQKTRSIDSSTLRASRFFDSFRVDGRQNAVFAYRSGKGDIVGVERRNQPAAGSDRSFMSYTAGGRPGIWVSATTPTDTHLVIVESAIDAMSYFELISAEEQAVTRFAALRNGCREEDLRAVIEAMPAGATIVAACDADTQGAKYNDLIRRLTPPDRKFVVQTPEAGDWNDILHRAKFGQTSGPSHRRP